MAVAPKTARLALPASVWALGFTSMLMDVSSEMIHSLLPVFLVTGLGVSMAGVGLIEGIAEATASITKIFSGSFSDWLGRRKPVAVIGYGLAALTKPIFPLADALGWVLVARFVDRVGKGIRGAPRDALIADITPRAHRGAAFGLRQSLDTIGAFVGPALAILLMALSGDNFKAVFWVAVIPAFIAVAILIVWVKEPPRDPARQREPFDWRAYGKLGAPFWIITALGVVFTLARFSEAFLILRAQDLGLAIALVPLVLVVMNIAYALAAYPAGALSDRRNRVSVLIGGIVLLILADVTLMLSDGLLVAAIGTILWGLHMGFSQGLLSSLVADTAPKALRGTAFGLFNLASGLTLLVASFAAGLLWDLYGPATTFAAGAGAAALAGLGLVIVRWRMPGLGHPQPS